MYVFFIMIAILSGITAFYEQAYDKYSTKEYIANGAVDPTTDTFLSPHDRQMIPTIHTSSVGTAPMNERDLIEAALQRTCRAVNIKLHQLNCTGKDSVSATWRFVGAPSQRVPLTTVWSGSKSNTISCSSGSWGRYGRYLVSGALPRSLITANNYVVRVPASNTGKQTDPCGHVDILSK